MTTAVTNPPGSGRRVSGWILREGGISLALIALVIFFSVAADNFATASNLQNILNQVTINTILATGMTYVILVAGIDLSVGAVMALAAISAGLVLKSAMPAHLSIPLALLAAIGVGGLTGFLNGWVSERWRLPSFIVTLGMLNIARGAALQLTDARTLYQFPRALTEFGSATLFGVVPAIFLVALALVALSWFVLSRTVFGRLIYAIGNNEEAVRLSGHRTSAYKVSAFVICGAMAGVAAIITVARLTIASPIVGVGFELNAIAAVIIGGTSLFGGKGSVIGTFFGACIIGVLTNGLTLMGVDDFIRQMFTGFVIILAVIIDHYRAKLARGRGG